MSRILLTFVIIVLMAAPSWAAIAVDQRAIGTAIASGTTLTKAFTNNAASPMIVACSANQNISGVTWNGTAMDVIQASLADGSAFLRTALFGLKSPAVGSFNIVATFASSVGAANCAMISTTGGDTTTGWRTVYTRTNAAGTGPGTTVVDSQNGDLVVHAAHVVATTITFDGGEDTTNTEDDAIAGGSTSMGLSTQTASGANTAIGTTDVATYAQIGVALIPAGAASRNMMLLGVGQ